ncbi:MAG: DUF1905 domain-containing protein [Bacteroidetes bacterium]|nr:DUF1905 domain-containing protein [Bacteroidota bacterium]
MAKPVVIHFRADILKFGQQGEKTGWTYIEIPADQAQLLKPDNKKSFRVKGSLDAHPITQTSLLPMGEGDFILPLNAAMRCATGKRAGDSLQAILQEDPSEIGMPEDFAICLEADEQARRFFENLPKSHRNYWIKWIAGVKGAAARENRILRAVVALSKGFGFNEMFREERNQRG